MREENPSILILISLGFIPNRTLKEVKTIIKQLLLHNKIYKLISLLSVSRLDKSEADKCTPLKLEHSICLKFNRSSFRTIIT